MLYKVGTVDINNFRTLLNKLGGRRRAFYLQDSSIENVRHWVTFQAEAVKKRNS